MDIDFFLFLLKTFQFPKFYEMRVRPDNYSLRKVCCQKVTGKIDPKLRKVISIQFSQNIFQIFHTKLNNKIA